jgi:hypothetical protein
MRKRRPRTAGSPETWKSAANLLGLRAQGRRTLRHHGPVSVGSALARVAYDGADRTVRVRCPDCGLKIEKVEQLPAEFQANRSMISSEIDH